jgi:hypothetical protein
MTKIKKHWRKIIIGFIVLAIFLFAGLKGFVKSTIHFDSYEAYQYIDNRGQVNRAFVLPEKTELVFSKNTHGTLELALFKIRGENATHYFGPLYNTGTFPFGLRTYSDAMGVWKAEMELIDRIGNVSQTTFDDVGKKYEVNIIFYRDHIEIGDESFQKIDFDPNNIKIVRQEFEK